MEGNAAHTTWDSTSVAWGESWAWEWPHSPQGNTYREAVGQTPGLEVKRNVAQAGIFPGVPSQSGNLQLADGDD